MDHHNPIDVAIAKSRVKKLAEVLGVGDLRSGRQIIRDHRGWLEDELEVDHAWHAWVMPSFHPWGLIGLVQITESEFRGKKHSAACWAAMVVFQPESGKPSAWASTELGADPLTEVIRAVDLMPDHQSMSLDGISYRICTSGSEIAGHIELHNPRSPTLAAIAHLLFRIAQAIYEHSKNDGIQEYLGLWQEYLKK